MTRDTHGFAETRQPKPIHAALSELGLLSQQALDAARGEGEVPDLTVASLGPWARRFSQSEIEDLIIPKRTLARRKAGNEPLNSEETDRAYRLARISAEADRVFANPDKADRWLRTPTRARGGKAPLALLKSEAGARVVEELLGQIDHGMFI